MRHNVLLVDDDPNVLMGLRRTFRNESFEVLMANSGKEALQMLRTVAVDLIVSDQEMPGMSGTELMTIVRDTYPDVVRFILTGKATLEVALQAINDGAVSRFFTKPCNEVELAVAIRQALQQKDLMTEAWRLLHAARKRSAQLGHLEADHPGITSVKRDTQGAVMVEDVSGDLDELIAEIRNELDKR